MRLEESGFESLKLKLTEDYWGGYRSPITFCFIELMVELNRFCPATFN